MLTEPEQLALAGFLACYSGLTRDAYMLDLRRFTSCCHQHGQRLFEVGRTDIECFARDLEAKGRDPVHRIPPPGYHRRLLQVRRGGRPFRPFPGGAVRRPRLDYESHAIGLDRNEIGALCVAAGLGTSAEHALISLLALNGLRVSEAVGADIEDLSTQRGHRVLAITRKGGKKAIAPLGPSTSPSASAAIGPIDAEWLFLRASTGQVAAA